MYQIHRPSSTSTTSLVNLNKQWLNYSEVGGGFLHWQNLQCYCLHQSNSDGD